MIWGAIRRKYGGVKMIESCGFQRSLTFRPQRKRDRLVGVVRRRCLALSPAPRALEPGVGGSGSRSHLKFPGMSRIDPKTEAIQHLVGRHDPQSLDAVRPGCRRRSL